jgi:hypothetical protein
MTMAHFAEINENNVVTRVLVVPNEQEHRGQDYLSNELNLGGTWIQCSYNTRNGIHILGGTPLRGNYPSNGHIYNSDLDAFILPKPESNPSFVLNETTYTWVPPIPMPELSVPEATLFWNEETLSWFEEINS